MWAHPGKKLLFMGGELAQEREWDVEGSLDWHLLEQPDHAGVRALVRDLNRALQGRAGALGGRLRPVRVPLAGAERRREQHRRLRARSARRRDAARRLCLQLLAGAALRLPGRDAARRARGASSLNTDSSYYGGSDVGNQGAVIAEGVAWHDQPFSAEITLPPLATVWLVPEDEQPAKPPVSRG